MEELNEYQDKQRIVQIIPCTGYFSVYSNKNGDDVLSPIIGFALVERYDEEGNISQRFEPVDVSEEDGTIALSNPSSIIYTLPRTK